MLGLADGLLLGLADALLLGLADALLLALGVAVALLLALGVLLGEALAFAVAVALALAVAVGLAVADWLALAEGDAELVAFVDLGFLVDESVAASRTIVVWLAGTDRRAEVAAGGWPHTLGAAALTAASAGVLPPRRPAAIPDETMAALATMPNAADPDRADFMAAPSSPWSSSSRPRVSSD